MTVSALVPQRSDDVERIARATEEFAFAPPEPVWAPLVGPRSRAAGRLLAFVAATGLGAGLLLWIVGSLMATAIRSAF
jgi:hypothetical protein